MAARISRRHLLQGAGAAALGAGLAGALGWHAPAVQAQDTPDLRQVNGLSRFRMGRLHITIVQDTRIENNAANFAVNAPAGAVNTLLDDNNLPRGAQNVPVNVMLVASGEELVLVDTGAGSAFGTAPGLLPTLAVLGIAPEAITRVLISHFHPDHIAGLADEDGLLFPNASVHLPQAEWDFLQNAPDIPALNDFIALAQAQLQPAVAADRLQLYADGAELVPGLQAVAAPGHTPGHHAFLLSAGRFSLLNLIDTANHHLISLANPGWHFAFDAVPDQASATRAALLARAATEKIPVFGYHFPFPGTGYIDQDGEGYRFIPAML
ncbi:MAG: MBL fold metallo-hydrolase [Anaerolineae bacterium]|nr:MBL fold metallo-hydrolase [Anaerolineae bacterium]